MKRPAGETELDELSAKCARLEHELAIERACKRSLGGGIALSGPVRADAGAPPPSAPGTPVQRVRRTRDQWEALLLKYRASGQKFAAWCRENSVYYVSALAGFRRVDNNFSPAQGGARA